MFQISEAIELTRIFGRFLQKRQAEYFCTAAYYKNDGDAIIVIHHIRELLNV